MRVVAGDLRGRRIEGPEGEATRPTTDKVREAVFNALNSMNAVREERVIDLFAGSGALGIEALSRGAAHCVFVENNRSALGVLRGNLAALGLEERSLVVVLDIAAHSSRQRLSELLASTHLVLADPPYAPGSGTAAVHAVAAALGGTHRLFARAAASRPARFASTDLPIP